MICSAVNPAGSASWKAKLVVMSPEDHPPPIIIQGPMNQTLPFKTVGILPCKAIGNPAPVISWYRDGVPLVTGRDRINISDSGNLLIQGKEFKVFFFFFFNNNVVNAKTFHVFFSL